MTLDCFQKRVFAKNGRRKEANAPVVPEPEDAMVLNVAVSSLRKLQRYVTSSVHSWGFTFVVVMRVPINAVRQYVLALLTRCDTCATISAAVRSLMLAQEGDRIVPRVLVLQQLQGCLPLPTFLTRADGGAVRNDVRLNLI